jgi:hypothetical protein
MESIEEATTVDKLTKIYVKIRDKRREIAKQDEELKEQLDLISQKLLDICKEQGTFTLRTEFGTVSRRVNKHYWASDWDAMINFMKDHDAFSLMQHRINNANMAQFLEENPDLHPPGLNADVNQTIVITKR